MSTRDPGVSGPESPDALAAVAAGAPDPALIGRLANELFAPMFARFLAPGAVGPGPSTTSIEPTRQGSSIQPAPPQAPTTGLPLPSAVAAGLGPGAPVPPSAPVAPPPLGPTFASPSALPGLEGRRLLPIGVAGAQLVPPQAAVPAPPSGVPTDARPPLDLPAGASPPTAPPAGAPAGLAEPPRQPSVMPTAEELLLVPRMHAGAALALPSLGLAPAPGFAQPPAPAPLAPTSAAAPPAPAAPGLRVAPAATPAIPASAPAPAFYFLDEGASAATAAPGLRLESLELRPESVTYDPQRLPALDLPHRPFDPRAIRRDFPILEERVHGKPLIWLDNAATTQKPNAVIDRVSRFYREENSNIHRAAHALAARATDAYEAAREKVRRFLGAGSTREIIFVRGATEGVNLVAQSWGRRYVGEGDEIVVTHLEHHANIVPWQQLCAEKGARLRVAPVNDRGELLVEELEKLLGPRTRLVAVTQVSNALGTVVPVQLVTELAHRHGARVLVDGAQSVSHLPVDVQAIGCDWFIFSGHKVFGPTGIGAVFGRSDVLDESPPWQGGGNMIADVTFEKTVYQPAPFKFEAGTGNIADAVGLGAALDYVLSLGRENIARYEHELLLHATEGLLGVPGLRIIGTAAEKAGVVSFVLDGFRTEDVGTALDREGIAVRSGHHCAQPILRRFGLESTVRPSFAPYNTCEDVDALVAALHRLQAGRGHRGL